jgi:hypothetical protein
MVQNFRIIAYLALLTSCSLFSYAGAVPELTKISDVLVDSQARTISGSYGQAINGLSFQQDVLVTHNGYQYVTYYNANRHVCIARRELPSGPWEKVELMDYYTNTNDAHNVISMGICPNDGTIHLAFDHHDSTLHYRVSQLGAATYPEAIIWNASLFGTVRNYLEQGKTVSGLSYPGFWQTPDGNMQMSYRYGGSGNGDTYLVDYDGSTGQWHHNRKVISRVGTFTDEYGTSSSRNAYMNSFSYGPSGELHATWCWRETAGGANHDIMYAYSNDGGYIWLNGKINSHKIKIYTSPQGAESQTLLTLNFSGGEDNVVGKATGDSATEKLITLSSPGVKVVDIGRYYGLMNQQTQAVDPQGRIHTVMWQCSDESYAYAKSLGYTSTGTWGHAVARRFNHYWRDTNGLWHHYEMPWVAGSRPKLFIRQNGDAFLIYQSVRNPIALGYGLYFIDGDLTICAASAQSNWTDWQIIYVEAGPFLNEMLGDPYRFMQQEVLSVMVQESPNQTSQSTPLRILDFALN